MAAGVDERAEAGLDVVADEAPDLGLARFDDMSRHRHADRAVVVAQVAIVRPGAQIHPFTDVAKSQKSFVILVAITVQDARLDLATDSAVRSDRGAAANLGAHNLRVRPDVARALESG